MSAEIHRRRERPGETEKITINLGYVELGHINLLVQEGFYSNRTDFIRTAIRNQLKVLGLASFAPDVTPTLASATIESITVLGALHASKEIKAALADRIT